MKLCDRFSPHVSRALCRASISPSGEVRLQVKEPRAMAGESPSFTSQQATYGVKYYERYTTQRIMPDGSQLQGK